ncbi:hypothetical protein EST38_g7786 [Candolleomyces aberdarensis]|uniref:Glucose receptor Git3 N-terminal domain-containing protein n=1 Tax=Candolleomyces aberdarensis TaxID=2316362 RepID=A0A4V1Q3C1_9AGAR|nr:hypothetical protein EST38_g7786 [Candolleomyces aberdarensis]
MSSDREPFSFDQRLGIYFSLQSSCLSAAAVVTLLSYAFIRWWKRRGRSSGVDSDASGSSLFLNLMLADLVQAIANMPNIRWMREGVNKPSFKLISSLVAYSNPYPLFVLILRWKVPRHAPEAGVAFIWIFIALVVGIPNAVHRNESYYGDTDYWCWVRRDFQASQLLSEYVWMWVSAFIMAILYGIMFLVMRGFLIVGNGVRWAKRQNRVKLDLSGGDDEEERAARAMANLLLFYPAVYIICVFPISLARWLRFGRGSKPPFQFTLFASALFSFSGLFNVILYFMTRREYAVGPSISVTAPALPSTAQNNNHYLSDKEASQISNSREDINYELDERYGRQSPLMYQNGTSPTGNLTPLSPNLTLHNTSPLHQSPASRTMPLGQGYGPAPPHSAGHLSASDSLASRGNTLNSGYQLDDDENDYGRLPG